MEINSSDEKLIFLICDEVSLASLLPFIKFFQKKRKKILFLVNSSLDSRIQEIKTKSDKIKIVHFEGLNYLIRRSVFLFLRVLFTPIDYSVRYKTWLKNTFSKLYFITLFFSQINSIFFKLFKLKKECINININSIMSFLFQSNYFGLKNPNNKIVTTSLFNNHCLLANKKLNIFLYVESWDHIYKFPFGFCPKKVFTWNKSLAKDWHSYQGGEEIIPSIPIKFNYLSNKKTNKIPNDIFIYPFSSCSKSTNDLYLEELKFVHKLCNFFSKEKNKKLLLKPKPNAEKNEIDYFLSYKNVEIGNYNYNKKNTIYYDISKRYNQKRVSEMKSAKAVINVATTYMFDASSIGLPIYQLQLNFSNFSRLNNVGTHIKNILNKNNLYIFNLYDFDDIEEHFKAIFNSKKNYSKAIKFSTNLRNWLYDGKSYNHHIENFYQEVLN